MIQAELDRRKVDPVLDEVIQDLLKLKSIQVVLKDTKVFLSSRRGGSWDPSSYFIPIYIGVSIPVIWPNII